MAVWVPTSSEVDRQMLLSWGQRLIRERLPGWQADLDMDVFGITRDGRQAGMVGYSWRAPGCYELVVALATPRVVTPAIVRLTFWNAFRRLGARRLEAIIAKGNHASIRLAVGVGMVREGILRQFYEGQDAVLLSMTADEWRSSRWFTSDMARAA